MRRFWALASILSLATYSYAETSPLSLYVDLLAPCKKEKSLLLDIKIQTAPGAPTKKIPILSCAYFKHFSSSAEFIKVASWPCHANEIISVEATSQSSDSLRVPLYIEKDTLPKDFKENPKQKFKLLFESQDKAIKIESEELMLEINEHCPSDPWTAGLNLEP